MATQPTESTKRQNELELIALDGADNLRDSPGFDVDHSRFVTDCGFLDAGEWVANDDAMANGVNEELTDP